MSPSTLWGALFLSGIDMLEEFVDESAKLTTYLLQFCMKK